MSTGSIEIVILLGTPIALTLASVWAFKDFRQDKRRWRNRISLGAVALVLLPVALWPIMAAFAPRIPEPSDPQYSARWDATVAYIETWHRIVLKMCALSSLTSFFGRPRTIIPTALAAVAVAVFWILSTAL